MKSRRILLLHLLLLGVAGILSSSSCMFGELSGIPCREDAVCPTEYFCDVPNSVCRQTRDDQSAPALRVTGLRVGDDKRASLAPTVPPTGASRLVMLVRNDGTLPADDVKMDLALVRCTGMVVADEVPERVDGGEEVEIAIDLDPTQPCSNPVLQDWFFTYSGRGSRGLFEIRFARD